MDKKFRDLILSQVVSVLRDKPPSRQALYDLLKIATPELKLHMIDNTHEREHAYKALKVIIHPDKHVKALQDDPQEMARITKIFQETSVYYNLCCGALAMESPNMSSSNSIGAPETVASTRSSRNNKAPTASPKVTKHMHSTSPSRFAKVPGSVTVNNSTGGKSTSTSTTKNTTTNTAKNTTKTNYSSSNNSSKAISTITSTSNRPDPYMRFLDTGKLPSNFDAFQQWPFMAPMMKAPPSGTPLSNQELSWIMACRCINFRGAVVHGQKIGRAYQVTKKQNELDKCKTPQDVFQHFGFRCRVMLKRIQDIKTEIITNGPVLSSSFLCREAIYKSHSQQLSAKQLHKVHPIILVGWCMTSAGELWKCHSVWGDTFEVGMGQFDIDKNVLAPPVATLETIPWQKEGPYLDLNMPSPAGGSSKDWRELRHMSISISAKELEVLGQILPGGFQKAISNKTSFVVRDKHKPAYSRRYTLREVTTDGGKWKISISQAET